MIGFFTVLMNIELDSKPIEFIEFLNNLNVVGLCELEFHFEIHDRLSEIGRKLLNFHIEEGAVKIRFVDCRRDLLCLSKQIEDAHFLFSVYNNFIYRKLVIKI